MHDHVNPCLPEIKFLETVGLHKTGTLLEKGTFVEMSFLAQFIPDFGFQFVVTLRKLKQYRWFTRSSSTRMTLRHFCFD